MKPLDLIVLCYIRWESGDEDNFSQATQFWCKTLNADERKRLVDNILSSLKDAAAFIQVNMMLFMYS